MFFHRRRVFLVSAPRGQLPGLSGEQRFRGDGAQEIFPELDLWVASNVCVGQQVAVETEGDGKRPVVWGVAIRRGGFNKCFEYISMTEWIDWKVFS